MDRVTSMTAFATVVTSGSFAAASQRLNMSPAMVTNHVRSLEERLGARLLNRTTRKLSLTEAGKSYFDQCALILAQIEAADSSVSELQAVPRGTPHLNPAHLPSPNLAPPITPFPAAHPPLTRPPDSSLIVRRTGQLRIILCAAPDYLAKHGAPAEPSDLSRHNCLAYTYRGFDKLAREWPLTGPGGQVTVPVTGNLQSNSIETLLGAAFEGRGIAMVTSCSAVGAIRSGRLVQVLPEWHSGEYPIIALYPHRQHIPAKVRSFLDFAGKHFAANPTCPDITAPVEEMMQRGRVVAHDGVAPAFMKPRRVAI